MKNILTAITAALSLRSSQSLQNPRLGRSITGSTCESHVQNLKLDGVKQSITRFSTQNCVLPVLTKKNCVLCSDAKYFLNYFDKLNRSIRHYVEKFRKCAFDLLFSEGTAFWQKIE